VLGVHEEGVEGCFCFCAGEWDGRSDGVSFFLLEL
jgi:hypothetical protein